MFKKRKCPKDIIIITASPLGEEEPDPKDAERGGDTRLSPGARQGRGSVIESKVSCLFTGGCNNMNNHYEAIVTNASHQINNKRRINLILDLLLKNS